MGEHKIAEKYFGLKSSFGFKKKNNIRINVIYNDAHLDGKFGENKHSATVRLNLKLHDRKSTIVLAAPTRGDGTN